MRQPDIDGLFSKGSPEKCGDLHLMTPSTFPFQQGCGWLVGISIYKRKNKVI